MTPSLGRDNSEQSRTTSKTDLCPSAVSLALMIASLFGLGGCQTIKSIFAAGFGIGAILVIAFVAIVGGTIAMVRRRS